MSDRLPTAGAASTPGEKSRGAVPNSEAGSTKRRWRWGRWLAGILVALLLVLFFLPNIVALPSIRRPWIDRTFARFNSKATIGNVSLGWFSPVAIENFEMQVDGTVANTLSIQNIRSNFSLLHLLFGSEFGSYKIDRPELYIEFNKEGNNLSRLLKALSGSAWVDRPIQFEIADGSLLLRGPNTANPWRLGGLNLNVDMTPANLSPTGVHVLRGTNAQFMKNTELTPEMCNDLLKFVVPPFASAVRTSGRVSLELDEFNWPLGKPDAAQLKGRLTLHSVEVGAGDISKSLTGMLHLPDLSGGVEIAKDNVVPFTMHEGRVYHENLVFTLPIVEPGLLVRSHGSVGLNETLDWYVELTLPADSDLASSPMLKALRETHPTIHFTGTLSRPVRNFEGTPGAAVILKSFTDWIQRRGKSREEPSRPSLMPGGRKGEPAPATPAPSASK